MERIKELIKTSWCQGAYWRDKNGNLCNSKDAVSYCLLGAIYVCGQGHVEEYIDVLVDKICGKKIFNMSKKKNIISNFNDDHSHKEVMELLENY